MSNPFDSLTSADAIKRAYRKLAKECHPDLRPDKEAAAIEFRELTRIYESALSAVKTKSAEPWWTPAGLKRKAPEPPPAKPSGPITHIEKVAPIDDYEYDSFGMVSRHAIVPAELLEYGGTMVIGLSHFNAYGLKCNHFQFEVPPKTQSGQRFRFQMAKGTVEIALYKGRR